MREQVSGVVLAGGLSSRLGRDKASEELLGRTLLQRVIDRLAGLVDEYVIVKAGGQELPSLEMATPVRVVQDEYAQIGPLGGLYTGLAAMQADRAIAVACDMPLLQPALLRELLTLSAGHDAAVPLNGLPEPLCAVYTAACVPAIRRRIQAGQYKMTGFYEDLDILYVEQEVWRRLDAGGISFLNVNSEADLNQARELLAGQF